MLWRHRGNPDPRAAAQLAARDLRVVLARVIEQGRREARQASHAALRAELALARAQGAGPIPEPAPPAALGLADAARAEAAADAYAKAWLRVVLKNLDDCTSYNDVANCDSL